MQEFTLSNGAAVHDLPVVRTVKEKITRVTLPRVAAHTQWQQAVAGLSVPPDCLTSGSFTACSLINVRFFVRVRVLSPASVCPPLAFCERGRGRERTDRQTERERERQTDRQTDRQTERETDRERERQRHAHTHARARTQRSGDSQTVTARQTDRQKDTDTDTGGRTVTENGERKSRARKTRATREIVGCLTSQQQASVSQGRICSDNFTCCHTEIEVADPTFYLTQSQYTDTWPTSPSTDPITPGAWQGSHWSANFWVTGMTRPRKNPGASGIWTRDLPLSRRTP